MIDKQVPQKLVSDKDQRLTRSGDMIDAQNVTIVNRGEGSEMVIKTMKGHNSAVAASGTTPINAEVRVIGAVPDDQLGVIYVFVASDTGHGEDAIYKYTASTNTYEKVLKRTALNFNKNSFVKADILNKAFQQDGVLQTVMYFTDNVNPPRKINVDRAISGDYDALSDLYFNRAISAIKSAPTKPPTFSFDTDSAVKVNHFEQSAMQFATQIIYKDNEESALSPYSKLAVSPVAAMSSTQIADFGLSIFTSNVCEIKHNVSLQHPDMKAVRLLARDGNDGPFFIIDEFDVTQNVVREVYGNSTTVYDIADQKYRFYNDVIGSVIPDTTANKLYDNVPLKAEGQVIRDSRLFYSNYTEGRPNHDISVTDFSLEPNYSAVGGSVKDYVADDEGPDMVTQVGTINIDLDIEAADDIGVHHEGERPVALRHPDQLVGGREGQRIGGVRELRRHLLEIGQEALLVERLDQPLGHQLPARPGLVEVDEIPDVDLARAQLVDHVRVRGAALGAHRGAGVQVAERAQHVIGVVAFPAQDVQLVLAGGTGGAGQQRRRPRGPETGGKGTTGQVHGKFLSVGAVRSSAGPSFPLGGVLEKCRNSGI